MKFACLLLIPLMLSACSPHSAGDAERYAADSCNERSYQLRYVDIDSAAYFADEALRHSSHYTSGREEAEVNKAFVAYQQMDFDRALQMLSHVTRRSRNQFLQLSAHVLTMKIAQRVGDGELFFAQRNAALRILQRVSEDSEAISDHNLALLDYARSELHIVSSTYYYYLGLTDAAVREINVAGECVRETNDMSQRLNYSYMLGSGGLIQGEPEEVALQEFGHLFRAYTLASGRGVTYFEANTLQALASLLNDTSDVSSFVRQQRAAACEYLAVQHNAQGDSALALALVQHAVLLFERYHDLYQTACAYRTLGEVYFSRGEYETALGAFLHALSLVEEQKKRSSLSVNPWMAGIRERLSMTYAALGDQEKSDANRNIYLDLLDEYRQNFESELRLRELSRELVSLRVRAVVLIVLVAFSVLLAVLYGRRMRRRNRRHGLHLSQFRQSDLYSELNDASNSVCQLLSDEGEVCDDALRMSQHHVEEYKMQNAGRRAKVSLVYSIIPYLDRMIAEVSRMSKSGRADADSLQYVCDLSSEIMRINESLTSWIQMSQGELTLHVSTFAINEILQVINLSRSAFEKKGLELRLAQSDARVKADKALTLFMVNTLADNARKFTPSGGSVSIDVQEEESYVEIGVSDTGVGLSPHDVEVLNDSKVYDASAIGAKTEGKGFGFGLMNCKGIIGKYRKTSRIFDVCKFGVSSSEGQGSRFWFRIPRARTLILLCGLLLGSVSRGAQTVDAYAMYDSVFNANVAGRHADALRMGQEILQHLPAEDTAFVVRLRNEIAVAALGEKDWATYRFNNDECVRLHKLYTQDKDIEGYVRRMQTLQDNGRVLYVLLVLFALFILTLLYFLFLRSGLRSGRRYKSVIDGTQSFVRRVIEIIGGYKVDAGHVQQVLESDSFASELASFRAQMETVVRGNDSLRSSVAAIATDVAACHSRVRDEALHLESLLEKSEKARFEEDRLYVMSQILDNSLSTIKHETMYYPARAQQMLSVMLEGNTSAEQINDLADLLRYYREVYMLLYRQAERQLEQHIFQRASISVSDAIGQFCDTLRKQKDAQHLVVSQVVTPDDARVLADRDLLQTLLRALAHDFLTATSLRINARAENSFVVFSLSFAGIEADDAQLENLFTAGYATPHCLIARQIVREHDACSGMPGLRLLATKDAEGGITICFTLQKN